MQLQYSMQLLNLLEAFHLLRISYGKLKQTSSNALRLWKTKLLTCSTSRGLVKKRVEQMQLLRLPLQSNLDLGPDILPHLLPLISTASHSFRHSHLAAAQNNYSVSLLTTVQLQSSSAGLMSLLKGHSDSI